MALVIGTNCGFVTVAPTADPAASNKVMDNVSWGVKDTTASGVTNITQVGWYCDNTSEEANFEIGLYSHNAVNNCPNTLLYSTTVNAKGTTAGWKTASVSWSVSGNTIYWIAVQLDNTVTQTNTNYTGSGALGSLGETPATQLQTTWPSTDNRNEIYAFYALTTSVTYVDVAGNIAAVSTIAGTLTYYTQRNLESTIAGVSAVSGTLTLSSNWNIDFPSTTIKRLTAVGNGSFYYEAI